LAADVAEEEEEVKVNPLDIILNKKQRVTEEDIMN